MSVDHLGPGQCGESSKLCEHLLPFCTFQTLCLAELLVSHRSQPSPHRVAEALLAAGRCYEQAGAYLSGAGDGTELEALDALEQQRGTSPVRSPLIQKSRLQ